MMPVGATFHETRIVNGIAIQVSELRWANGARSFEVIRVDDEAYLGLVDGPPSDDLLAEMLASYLSSS